MRSFGFTRGRGSRLGVLAVAIATVATTVFSSGASIAQDQKTINVAIVGNPQMSDIDADRRGKLFVLLQ